MKSKLFFFIYLLYLQDFVSSSLFRLNIPRVLLPISESKIVNFTLEVKSDNEAEKDDFCFVWSSTHSDVASVTPIYESRNLRFNSYDCSTRAVVSALSKYSERKTSVISAIDKRTNTIVRCDVIVDKIHSIRIKQTTNFLYLEDSLEALTAEALDSESNVFTSIEGLQFEWKILNDQGNTGQVVRIIKLTDSEYQVSKSIKELESSGLFGEKILIEGIKTGIARVQATLKDSNADFLESSPIKFFILTRTIINPSHSVYLLKGASIDFSAFLVKHKLLEKISFPNNQYYFESSKCRIANFDHTDYHLVTYELGTTEITLVDRNVDMKLFKNQNINYKPPSVLVNVVKAEYLIFSLKNWPSWILENGREYQFEILLLTNDNHYINPVDDLKIESDFPKFSVLDRNQNGSFILVKAFEKGVSLIKGLFKENMLRGEQQVEIFDPISIEPSVIAFVYSSKEIFYEYMLQIKGGSGSYLYQTKNDSIAEVDFNGLVKISSNVLGETEILVSDQRNSYIKSEFKVMVIEPISIFLEPCPVETLLNSKLEINVKMNGVLKNGSHMPILNCSKLNFNINIEDEKIFSFEQVTSGEKIGENCAKIILNADKVGKTSIIVTYKNLRSHEMNIYSLSQLKSFKKELLLAKSSSYLFSLSDGPFLHSDSSRFVTEFKINPNGYVRIDNLEHESVINSYPYRISCSNYAVETESEIEFTVWNKPTSQNKCPIKLKYNLLVRCSTPKILEMSQLFVKNEDSEQEIYRDLKWNCPIRLSSKYVVTNLNNDFYIQLLVKDSNGYVFDNFTNLEFEWKVDSNFFSRIEEVRFLNLRPIDQNTLIKESNFFHYTFFYQKLNSAKKLGDTKIELKMFTDGKNYLENFLNVRIVDDLRIEPTQLSIFNHPSNIKQLHLFDGSGYFEAEIELKQYSLLKINRISDSVLEISPINKNGMSYINVFDYCMPPKSFDPSMNEFSWEPTARTSVNVVGIASILVDYEESELQEGEQLEIFVQLIDNSGNLIHSNISNLISLEANIEGDRSSFSLKAQNQPYKTDYSKKFLLIGLKAGLIKIIFEAKSNENLIKSIPKEIEIFVPFRIEKKVVELILDAYYQIEYIGGLIYFKNFEVRFETNDNNIIDINKNGLVKSLSLGMAKVNVTFTNNRKLNVQEFIEFRIIGLTFIKIHLPLTKIKAGNKFPLHILANNLSPFYFATSKYFQYKWTLNDNTLAEIIRNDGFSLHIRTKESGLLRIYVTVLYMDREFKDSVEIEVLPWLIFSNFESELAPKNIILCTPRSFLQMTTNYDWQGYEITYELQYGLTVNECPSAQVKISSEGLLKISDVKADCSFGIKTSVYLESTIQILYYLIKVKQTSYRMLQKVDELKFTISYHDNLGDEFYVLNSKSSLRLNNNNSGEIIKINQNVFGNGPGIVFLANSKENSFEIRRIKDEYLILELSSNLERDFIRINSNFVKNRIFDLYVGDILCNFTLESNSIIKSFKNLCCSTGIAFEPGRVVLKDNNEYVVRDLDTIYFEKKESIFSNALNFDGTPKTTDHVEFSASLHEKNDECSNCLECTLSEDIIPFDCHASLYNNYNEHIDYLDRLIKTKILFKQNKWICKVIFESNSATNMYGLMLSYLDKTSLSNQLKQEPDRIKIKIIPKYMSLNHNKYESQIFKFVPAFYVKTKVIELSKSANLKSKLVIKLTSSMKPNLIITTNIPELISFKKQISISDFDLIYGIEKKKENFNSDEISQIMINNDGNFYIQVIENETRQMEKIEIKISEFSACKTREGICSMTKKSFKKISDFSLQTVTKLLVSILFILIGLTVFYRLN